MRSHLQSRLLTATLLTTATLAAQNPAMPNRNPYLGLMLAANAHAKAHGVTVAPVLSPDEAVLLSNPPQLDVASLHHAGFRVIPWNPNTPAAIRTILNQRVDGLITDRPDIARKVLAAEGIELPHPRPAISTGSKPPP